MQATLETPIGNLVIDADSEGLRLCAIRAVREVPPPSRDDSPAARRHLAAARDALHAYFRGARRDFHDLVLAPLAGTPFQQRVWRALRAVPYGATVSYGALARRLGEPGAARAVGLANGRNPLAIIQPCHRVIGSDGRLVGYRGGLARKAWLLRHEGAVLGDDLCSGHASRSTSCGGSHALADTE
jgi:methylated-DNA-[protein]-cysteine S-methyltransferase